MRFVHTADTHIGASHQGRAESEEDFKDVFCELIDKTLELSPEAFVHAGDLFDRDRPSVKDICFVANQLLRLIRNRIEVILLPGNHERRSIRGEMAPQSILELLGAKVFGLAANKVFYRVQDVEFWGIPYVGDGEALRRFISEAAEKAKSPAILVLHQYIYPPAKLSPILYPEDIPPVFSYAALGHWHIPFKGERYAYPGSTEVRQLTPEEAEVGQRRFYLVEIDGNSLSIETHYLTKARPFFYLDCAENEVAERMSELAKRMAGSPKKPILKIRVRGGPRMRVDEVVDSALLSANLTRKDFFIISTEAIRTEGALATRAGAEQGHLDAAEKLFGDEPELLGVVLAMREAIIKAEAEGESSGVSSQTLYKAIIRSAQEAAEEYLKEKGIAPG